MFGLDFQFEQISFLLGFVAATLFWWLISALRSSWPKIKAFIIEQRENQKMRRLAGLDAQIREIILQRSQKSHLASSLFPLSDIIITPKLITPPVLEDPDNPSNNHPLIQDLLPYAPQWPELASSLHAPMLTLPEALINGADIAIIGQPGSGKSVALAYLASLIARRESAIPAISSATPFLIHVMDLRANLDEKKNPLEILVKTISPTFPLLLQRQLPHFIETILQEGKLLLLLDGLDELPLSDITLITKYIKSLKEQHTSLRLVLAASPDCLDGLTELDITPLALATWNREQITEFVNQWGTAWTQYVSPVVQKQMGTPQPSPFLLNSWLTSLQGYFSPLEWTAKVWSLYAGDIVGSQPSHDLESLYKRLAGDGLPPDGLSALASMIIQGQRGSVTYSDADKYLSKFRLSVEESPQAENEAATSTTTMPKKTASTKSVKLSSSGSQILNKLLDSGLLNEYSDGSITFTSPLFTGYFSTLATVDAPTTAAADQTSESSYLAQLSFLTEQGKTNQTISSLLNQDEAPLFPNTLMVTRWLKNAPANAEARSIVMRKIVQLIQTPDLPLNIRIRLMVAAAASNETAISGLSRQWLTSKSSDLRLLAAIGVGMTQDSRAISDLAGLFMDPDINLQIASCYGLSAINTPLALESLQTALEHGDETLRMAVGETLAAHDPEGHKILQDAILSDDLLVRRAAVNGIARINAPWAISLLEKVAVEDAQWVVRNAAGQALDERAKISLNSPVPLVPPHESPWLLNYASKQGVGLSPNQSALPMLMDVLHHGTTHQVIASLEYLKHAPSDDLIRDLNKMVFSEDPSLQDAAISCLTYIKSGGGPKSEN